MSQVSIFLATGFEETEAIAIIDVLRRADISTTIVSVTGQTVVTGSHGISILTDALFEAVNFTDGQMLVLPGGMPGTNNLEAFAPLTKLINEYYKSGKYLAAICAAPLILGKMRLLRNEEAICYPGYEEHLEDAILSKERVVRSGKIITGKGPGTAIEFGLLLVETLKGKELADTIKKAMIQA
ncbi:MAG: DJ-1/PfpI family protein, partial [Paludibacteraceae bacterium]|nr:DJ-1/PfpI family protein [Paludibacteraceae bacterium]MBN2787637.1 DJ-1/PfpI family protein [Paludibacteraceae bacterium]